ncbi:hypothetical protein CMQ_2783 [Grosmannia clavigera kw1407]|uniref:Uncharacterized protein n=1 Tax=Grosmannia clavigera (strain kw1407 / UAMH 11150) TaxID=655863 RepID=F0XGA3_GROCL|nr:uncharacterized protein CMQ_2783 [Grosmannia clavigera kw1407]EFX02854.1 hypothetical protein CMQ_2783 [Grosmannia clavigera kw1407]
MLIVPRPYFHGRSSDQHGVMSLWQLPGGRNVCRAGAELVFVFVANSILALPIPVAAPAAGLLQAASTRLMAACTEDGGLLSLLSLPRRPRYAAE